MSKKYKVKIKHLTFSPTFASNKSSSSEEEEEDLVSIEFPFGNFLMNRQVWELMKKTQDDLVIAKEQLNNLLGKRN
jgi:hypothetical protein